jgi:glycosyltransferase involved in cell wall biosynthesis
MELLVHLAKAFPRVQFLWIGGREPDVETWRDRIKTDGIKNILLTGFIPNAELPLYQAAADILLMPYGRNVGISGAGDTADVCSPMKLFDYLSAGRAILSSDLPVIREVLSEDNARFAQPDDPASWESVLGRMIADEPLRAKLSANAKLDAERYSWLRRAQATVDYFESDVGI